MYNPPVVHPIPFAERNTVKRFLLAAVLALLPLVPSAAPADDPGMPPEIPGLDAGLPLPEFGLDIPDPSAAPTPPTKVDTSRPSKAAEPTAVPTEPAASAVSSTPSPAAPSATPTATRKPSKPPKNPTPTATVTVTETPAPTAEAAAFVLPTFSGPARMIEFFPAEKGQLREYQFLRVPGQTVGRKNRTVECLKVQTFPNGTIRSMHKTTVYAGGTYRDDISNDVFSVVGNTVVWLMHNGQPQTNRFLLKMPKPGATERWTHKEADGTTVSFKADLTPLKTDERVYPECILVVEKTLKAGEEPKLRNLYYARGLGLVRLEVYGADLKMDRTSSIDLVLPLPTPIPTP